MFIGFDYTEGLYNKVGGTNEILLILRKKKPQRNYMQSYGVL